MDDLDPVQPLDEETLEEGDVNPDDLDLNEDEDGEEDEFGTEE